MGRPPRHNADRLLDAAVEVVTASGPSGLTMAAVARAAGAPSGSVYHRFPNRPALLAQLWLRTVERFQHGFLAALEDGPPQRAAAEAARHVVAWSRSHMGQARVLSYGPAAFDAHDWPAEAHERLAAANRRVSDALRALAGRTERGSAPALDPERLFLATVDLPHATVRRHLASGGPIPAHAEDLVAEGAAWLLSGAPAPSGRAPSAGPAP